jgi:hypothetical protein
MAVNLSISPLSCDTVCFGKDADGYTQHGGNLFLQSVGICLQNCMVLSQRSKVLAFAALCTQFLDM